MGASESAFTLEHGDQETVIRVRCEVDANTSPTLERLALRALGEGTRGIALDLGECPLLDSAGVRTLLRIRRRADQGSLAFRIARCSDLAARLIRRLQLDGFLGLPRAAAEAPRPPMGPRFRRLPLQVPVHVWDGLIHRTGHTRGFSPEGLVMDLPGPLRVFEVLRLELAPSDAEESFRFMGRVLHFQPGLIGAAEVEFLSIEPAMRLWLQRHLADDGASAPRRRPSKPAFCPATTATPRALK